MRSAAITFDAQTNLTLVQEEDFVTNLYNRHLLSSFKTTHFESLLCSAVDWITDQEVSIPKPLITAIVVRLNFRKVFLQAVNFDADVISQQKQNNLWDECAKALPELLESRKYGVAVDNAFSSKIQRRLASTVPPRPIVNINFDDAYTHIEKLCKDGKDVARVLECKGGTNILVAPLILCIACSSN